MSVVVISFAEAALRDLEAVQDRYTRQRVPDVGTKWVAEVSQRFQSFADRPDS